jgi:hypothetical protein
MSAIVEPALPEQPQRLANDRVAGLLLLALAASSPA